MGRFGFEALGLFLSLNLRVLALDMALLGEQFQIFYLL